MPCILLTDDYYYIVISSMIVMLDVRAEPVVLFDRYCEAWLDCMIYGNQVELDCRDFKHI